jgi:hypothetical protein
MNRFNNAMPKASPTVAPKLQHRPSDVAVLQMGRDRREA